MNIEILHIIGGIFYYHRYFSIQFEKYAGLHYTNLQNSVEFIPRRAVFNPT